MGQNPSKKEVKTIMNDVLMGFSKALDKADEEQRKIHLGVNSRSNHKPNNRRVGRFEFKHNNNKARSYPT